MMLTTNISFFLILVAGSVTFAEQIHSGHSTNNRKARLFFASISSSTTTTTTTSTLLTNSFCWTSGGTALTATCGRKKRSIFDDPISGDSQIINPSTSSKLRYKDIVRVEEGEETPSMSPSHRDSRFFLLLTSTSTISATTTSTVTSFTVTSTLTVLCTPGFNACG